MLKARYEWVGAAMFAVALAACGGGGSMAETPAEPLPEAASPQPTPPTAPEPAPTPAYDVYEAELVGAVLSDWRQPNRPSSTQPRIGVVIVTLGPRGRLVDWRWRRRSPDGFYNGEVEGYLNRLQESPRIFPLPPEGSEMRRRVLQEGVAVEFADDDA